MFVHICAFTCKNPRNPLLVQEWSLFTRNLEAGVVPTCAELGIPVVAYSPVGRARPPCTPWPTSLSSPPLFQ